MQIPKILQPYIEQNWDPRAQAHLEGALRVLECEMQRCVEWEIVCFGTKLEVNVCLDPDGFEQWGGVELRGFEGNGRVASFLFVEAAADFLGVTMDELFLAIGEVR